MRKKALIKWVGNIKYFPRQDSDAQVEPNSYKKYLIVPFFTGCFGGGLDENKLQETLNQHGAQGWRFARSIHETKKVALIFQRETHFLVFERDA